MNRSDRTLRGFVREVLGSQRARQRAALLAFAILAPACGGGGGGGGFFPTPGLISFQTALFTVNEPAAGTTTATITVTRSGGIGAVSVNYATSNGTAGAADYTAANGTLAWANGDVADKTFTVTIANDALVEGDETVNLTLSGATGGAVLGLSSAVLVIKDFNAPAAGVVQFDSATYSVVEGIPTATITVTRTGGTTGIATVDFSTTGGTATGGGTDFTLTPGTLNWAAGDGAPKTFTIAIVNDALPEPTETVNLLLSNVTGAALGTTFQSVLSIIDNDSNGVIQFNAAGYTVSESGVTATITATRTGGVGGAVGVTYATSNGTATAGTDYTAATGSLLWADGDSADKTFTVSITDNLIVDGNRTVTLTLSAPTGGATLGAQSVSTLTIQDDDCTLQFTLAAYPLAENGTALIAVSRVGSTAGAVSVDFSNPAGGTATAGGTDYTFTAGTLNWAIGDGASKMISIPITADALSEGDQTINLLLSNAAGVGAHLGTQTTAVATIVDDDVTFVFSSATYSVNEGAGNAILTVNRVGAGTGAASVTWTVTGGTALNPADYTGPITGVLNWATGDLTAKTITIPIVSDTLAEPNETIIVDLSLPTLAGGDSVTVGTPGQATLTIVDDDTNFAFSSATYSGAENAGAITVTVNRTGITTGTSTVVWSILGTSTATLVTDYAATPGTLTFNPGDTTKTFTITPVNDAVVEGSETVDLQLTSPTGGTLAAQSTATVTILDDDVPNASINNVSLTEGDAGTKNFTFTITLSAAPVVAGSVTVNTANGTTNPATAGTDYVAIVNQVVAFGIGVTSMPVTVVVNGDTTDELDETFFVNLSAPVNLNITGAQGTGTILNDDDPTISIGNASTTEGNAGTKTLGFTVTLSHASLQDVVVNYSTANGTATAGSDYVAVPAGVLTITAGNTTGTINITINGDTTDEPDETFTVTMSSASNTASITTPTATGTIQNDDVPTVTIGNLSFLEGTGATTIFNVPVSISNPSSQPITVTYSTADGTAIAPGDYTPVVGGTIIIPAGNPGPFVIPITVAADAVDETNETFTVTITNLSYGLIGGTGIATVTIQDDDGPNITINNVSQPEGNAGTSLFAFTVTLSAVSAQDVTVHYSTANGTATAGSDYVAIPDTILTITAGNTTGTINVTVNGDTTSEPDETFFVNLSGAVNGTITVPQGVGTILTDDLPGISINNVIQPEGNVGTSLMVFTVSLTNVPSAPVSANFTTQDGVGPAGAVAPGDYTTTSGPPLSWGAGDGSIRTISVPIVGDSVSELDETFQVILSSVVGANVIQGTGTGTIANDDGPTISIGDVTQAEGNAGTTNFVFTVNLSFAPPVGQPVSVTFQTNDGTATLADSDYVQRTPTLLVISNPATSGTITVQVNGDNKNEPNETFTVTLSGAVNGSILSGTGTGTITNDDPVPQISIGDVTLAEGNAGTTAFNFPVTLSNPSSQIVTVVANTQDGTATLADNDYQQVLNQTVTFNPGVTSQTVTVNVNGDTNFEANETFFVNLTGQVNATILDAQGLGTITNDEGPQVSSTDPPDQLAPPVNPDTNLVITFNQPMVKASVESRFSLTPLAGGVVHSFFWDTAPGNLNGTILTVVFDTIAPLGTITGDDLLADNTTYTWTIAANATSASAATMPMQTGQFKTLLDTTPPQISSVLSNGAQDPRTQVLTGAVTGFTIVFNEPMNTSAGGASVNLQSQSDQRSASAGGGPGPIQVSWTNSTTLSVTLTPALTANSGYRMEVWGGNDANGNWSNNNLRCNVITAGTKINPPFKTASFPPTGATLVNRDTSVFIAVSEALSPDVATRVLVSGATPVKVRYDVGGDGPTGVEITPKKAWPAGVPVTVTIPGGVGGVTNASGVPFAANVTVTFTPGATGAGANPIAIDVPFSSLKSGAADWNAYSGAQGALLFKDSVSNARIYLDETTLTSACISVTDPNGIPVKNFLVNANGSDEVGRSIEINRRTSQGTTSLQQGTIYTIALKTTILGSVGQTFAGSNVTFTTVPNSNTLERPSASINDARANTAAGPPLPTRMVDLQVSTNGSSFAGSISAVAAAAAGNTDYTISSFMPGWVAPAAIVRISGCTNSANNGVFTVVSVSGGGPPTTLRLNNAAGVLESSPPGTAQVGPPINIAVADVTGGGNTFSVASMPLDSGGNGFRYSSGGNEAGFVSSGLHTLRYTVTDGVVAHQHTIDGTIFFFSGADMSALVLNVPASGTTLPHYTWTGAAPASATAYFIGVEDNTGNPIGQWVIPPTSTFFDQPPNFPLTIGQQYKWTIGFFHTIDGTLRGDGGDAQMNKITFTP